MLPSIYLHLFYFAYLQRNCTLELACVGALAPFESGVCGRRPALQRQYGPSWQSPSLPEAPFGSHYGTLRKTGSDGGGGYGGGGGVGRGGGQRAVMSGHGVRHSSLGAAHRDP